MVLFVSSLTKSVLQVILLLWLPEKDFLKDDMRRRSKPKHQARQKIKAHQQADLQRWTGFFFFFLFIQSKSGVVILFSTLNPQLTGV